MLLRRRKSKETRRRTKILRRTRESFVSFASLDFCIATISKTFHVNKYADAKQSALQFALSAVIRHFTYMNYNKPYKTAFNDDKDCSNSMGITALHYSSLL